MVAEALEAEQVVSRAIQSGNKSLHNTEATEHSGLTKTTKRGWLKVSRLWCYKYSLIEALKMAEIQL